MLPNLSGTYFGTNCPRLHKLGLCYGLAGSVGDFPIAEVALELFYLSTMLDDVEVLSE
jgi:hypothetical protein